jgi:hypothetical protein
MHKTVSEFPDSSAAASSSALSPRRWAVLAAFSVFCLGFATLNVFTFLGIGQSRLPGLYTFRAATIGDGFLLPLLAYSLVRSVGLQRQSGRYRVILSRAGCALGASIGTAVQLYALADPDARFDWTFPAPHFYNLPGWYHTVFLIVASGFYGWMLGLVLARIREEAQRDELLALRRIRSIGSLGVLIPGLAFLGLLLEDDISGNPAIDVILLTTMIGLGIILCAILYWACGLRNLQWCVLTVLGSLLPAAALCSLFLPGHAASLPAAALAAAVVIAVIPPTLGVISRSSDRKQISPVVIFCFIVCQTVCAAGPAYAISTGKPATISRLAVSCLAGLLLAGCELGVLQALLHWQLSHD